MPGKVAAVHTWVKWVVVVMAALLGAAWWTLRDGELVEVRSPQAASPPPPLPPKRDESGQPSPPTLTPSPAQMEVVAPTPRLLMGPVVPEAIAAESALIDRARSEAKARPQAALESLIEHRKRFPEGQLRVQAELVRLEAFLRLGQSTESENLARKLIAHDPTLRPQIEQLTSDAHPK